MRKVLYQWAKADSLMLINAGSLVGTTAVTSVLGFAYWWIAARQFSTEAVGLASAAISAMTLLGTLSVVGLGTLLVGELPRQPGKEAPLISAALIVVGGIGGCLGITFAAVAPFLSVEFQPLRASVGDMTLFAVGVSLTAIAIVLDSALIGLLRAKLLLWRNTLFAVIKLAVLFIAGLWLLQTTGLTIYATWVIGNALSLATLAGLTLVKRARRSYLPQWGLLRKLGATALKHHALNLTLDAPVMILPVLVTVLLSATTNAWFYIAWSISSIANVVTSALTVTLYAVSSGQPALLARKIRVTLSLAFLATALVNCVLLLGTTQVLGLFGQSYAEHAAWSLRILAVESFPFIIKSHYIAVCRIQGRVGYAARVTIATGLLELGGSVLGAYLGDLTGLSLGWFVVMCVEAVFMSRTVYKAAQKIDVSTNMDQPQQHTSNQGRRRIISANVNKLDFGK